MLKELGKSVTCLGTALDEITRNDIPAYRAATVEALESHLMFVAALECFAKQTTFDDIIDPTKCKN